MKKFVLRFTVAVLAMVGAIVPATAASASADGCDTSSTWVNPATCLSVEGGGLSVTRITGGVLLNSRQSTYGYWDFWGPRGSWTSHHVEVWNDSYFAKQIYEMDVPSWMLGEYPDGSQICARYWRRNGDGSQSDRGAACIRIHR